MTARSIFSLSVFTVLISLSLFWIQTEVCGANVFRNTLTLTIDAVVSRKPVVRF